MKSLLFFFFCGLAVYAFVGGVSANNELPPCNGETLGSGGPVCGEPRGCSDPVPVGEGVVCEGTTVVTAGTRNDCVGGSANELCEPEDVKCTVTQHCKVQDGGCVGDINNPALGPDGKPIISTDELNVLKSCDNS